MITQWFQQDTAVSIGYDNQGTVALEFPSSTIF